MVARAINAAVKWRYVERSVLMDPVLTAFRPRIAEPLPPDATRDNMAALEAEVRGLQAKALGAMTGVQLPHDEMQRIVAGVEKGPPGWVPSPIVSRGHATAQVKMGNGRG